MKIQGDSFYFRVLFKGLDTYYNVRRVLHEHGKYSIISDLDNTGYINIVVMGVWRKELDEIKRACGGSGVKPLDCLTVEYMALTLDNIIINDFLVVADFFRSFDFEK